MGTPRLVIYGDFNCPWSDLALRRAELLTVDGFAVEWRAVEHDPTVPGRPAPPPDARSDALREELLRVRQHLLPSEEMPGAPPRFVPRTKPAVSGYAEAYGAGVAREAARLLLDGYWAHGLDIGDPILVRTLLVDVMRAGASASEPVHVWGYAVTRTGTPITTGAHRRVARWRADWLEAGKEVVPMLGVDGDAPRFGTDAVDWLGDQIEQRGLRAGDGDAAAAARRSTEAERGRPALTWASEHGGRWIRPYQSSLG
jgi:DSBA-like thioredoxin domain